MLDNELEIAGGCQAVQWNRNYARFDGTPEKEKEFGTVFNYNQDPLAAPNSQIREGIAYLVDCVEQFSVGHVPIQGSDRHFVAASFGDVAVYEVLGSIEWFGKAEPRDALAVYLHYHIHTRPPTRHHALNLLARRFDSCDSDHAKS